MSGFETNPHDKNVGKRRRKNIRVNFETHGDNLVNYLTTFDPECIASEGSQSSEPILNPKPSMKTSTETVGTCEGQSTSSVPIPHLALDQSTIVHTFDTNKTFQDGGIMEAMDPNRIVYMIAVHGPPLSVGENNGFKTLLKLVAPQHAVLNLETITERFDEKFKLLSNEFKNLFSKLENLSVTTDRWVDFNNREYLSLTVHYVNPETTKLEKINLGMEELVRHRSVSQCSVEYLSKVLKGILKEWSINLDAVVAVTTDHDLNLTIYDTFGRHRHIPCFASMLNLIVKKWIDGTPQFDAVVKKVITIASFFEQSWEAAHKLDQMQADDLQNGEDPVQLILRHDSRWNSKFYIIERFMKLKNYVSEVLTSLPKKKNTPEMVTQSDLQLLEDLTKILSKVEKVITEMSRETYVAGSKIIPFINILTKSLEKIRPNHDISESILKNLLKELNRKFYAKESNVEEYFNLAIPTLLDPRFKKIHFRKPSAVDTAVATIRNLMKKKRNKASTTVPMNTTTRNIEEPGDDLWSVHDKLRQDESRSVSNELEEFLGAETVDIKEDLLESWRQLRNKYPTVYKVAMNYIVVMGTSVPSERVFGAAEDVISAKSSRPTVNRASAMKFLGSLPQRYFN